MKECGLPSSPDPCYRPLVRTRGSKPSNAMASVSPPPPPPPPPPAEVATTEVATSEAANAPEATEIPATPEGAETAKDTPKKKKYTNDSARVEQLQRKHKKARSLWRSGVRPMAYAPSVIGMSPSQRHRWRHSSRRNQQFSLQRSAARWLGLGYGRLARPRARLCCAPPHA